MRTPPCLPSERGGEVSPLTFVLSRKGRGERRSLDPQVIIDTGAKEAELSGLCAVNDECQDERVAVV